MVPKKLYRNTLITEFIVTIQTGFYDAGHNQSWSSARVVARWASTAREIKNRSCSVTGRNRWFLQFQDLGCEQNTINIPETLLLFTVFLKERGVSVYLSPFRFFSTLRLLTVNLGFRKRGTICMVKFAEIKVEYDAFAPCVWARIWKS